MTLLRRKAFDDWQPYELLGCVESHGQAFQVLRIPGQVVPFIGLAEDYEPVPEVST